MDLMQHQMESSKWWAVAGGLVVILGARTVEAQKVLEEQITERLSLL